MPIFSDIILAIGSVPLGVSWEFLLGLSLGYLLATLAESFLHDHVHHAGKWFRSLQRRFPRALGAFRDAYRAHTEIHHRTYRDHVTQFASAEEKSRIDALLQDRTGRRIIAERYGETINLRSTVLFIVLILPAVVPLLDVLPWAASIGFSIPVAVYPMMSKFAHPYLHMRYDDALRKAPPLLRRFFRTRYMRCVWRNHWMHHRYPHSNFNLVLGGDWLRGVHRRATEADLERMQAAGMPVD
jgi:hypothetical protein